MKRTTYVFCYIAFVLSLIIAAALLIADVVFIAIIQAIPAIIAMSVLAVFASLMAYHYHRCLVYLKGNREITFKRLKRVLATNKTIALLFFSGVIGLGTMLLYMTVMLNAFYDFQVYFLCVVVVCVLFVVASMLIEKALKNATR